MGFQLFYQAKHSNPGLLVSYVFLMKDPCVFEATWGVYGHSQSLILSLWKNMQEAYILRWGEVTRKDFSAEVDSLLWTQLLGTFNFFPPVPSSERSN